MKAVTQSFTRMLLKIGACVCVGLGVIGAFLPVLPTTPFLILATVLSYNASPKIRQWILDHPVFGSTVQNYIETRAITVSALRSALVALWLSIAVSIFLVSVIWVGVTLVIIGGLVTLYLLRLRRI